MASEGVPNYIKIPHSTRFADIQGSMSAKVKRGREKGDGKNSVINCRKTVVFCRDAL